MHLQNHYNNLWRQSLRKFRNDEFEYDSLIDAGDDTRYGITLLARPSEPVKQHIAKTLDEIKSTAPNQYYYPSTDLHVTVLSIISCHAGFTLNDIDPSAYRKVVQSAVGSLSSFTIHFRGITASPSCVLVQGFPEGNQLLKLRDTLRETFKASGLQHAIDQRYRLKTAHMTAIRFKEPLEDPELFINRITDLRDKNFGSSMIDQVELVGNDWYQRKEKVTPIGSFPLG